MFNLVVLWRDVVSRGVDYVFAQEGWGDFLVGKFEGPYAMGVSGPTPLRGSLPRLLRGPGGPLPVQGQPGPSGTKGSRALRNCLQCRYAGPEPGWTGVGRGENGDENHSHYGPLIHTSPPKLHLYPTRLDLSLC